MKRPLGFVVLGIVLTCIAFVSWLGPWRRQATPPTFDRPLSSPRQLAEHSEEFRREVIEAAPGVHVAVGYGLANSILLIGDEGAVVVDTLESIAAAEEVATAFRELTDAPIRALIYTHNHADHVFGAAAFADPEAPPEVIAHVTTAAWIDRLLNVVRPIIGRRSVRMFGSFLDDTARVNCGIGPELRIDAESAVRVLRPTRTVDDRLELSIAGLDLVLEHAPGETDDQLFVWLPEHRVLLPGDNFYRAFPNLYTIRGTPYRDVVAWVRSLDRMRALGAEVLVPSHSRPVVGAAAVDRALTDYRDAIQYVHDQTVRGMNLGMTPDALAATVNLPPHLAESPYLQELYGKVSWSVRAIYSGYLGWFDGNPSRLDPHPPAERARRMAALVGGVDGLRRAVAEAEAADDPRWVLELTDHLLELSADDRAAREARVRALTLLGEAEGNPNARHTYLTRALELGSGLELFDMAKVAPEMLHAIPTASYFANLSVRLDPTAVLDIERRAGFVFPDTGEAFTLHVRRGVAEVRPTIDDPSALDLQVTLDAVVFKEMLAGLRNPAVVLAGPAIDVDGSRLALVELFSWFG
ncbi:MAG: alkyl sulfatase dimerization domain-containing protein [Acidobacteriota bacterium]